MKESISVLGPPACGKNRIVEPYKERVIQVGEFAHSLPRDGELGKRCMACWQNNIPFDSDLLERLLNIYPFPNFDWIIFNGTPRGAGDYDVVRKFYNLHTLIEINVDYAVWMERAKNSINERNHRKDSSLSQLMRRRDVYCSEIDSLRSCFNRVFVVDNSDKLEDAQQKFINIIQEMFYS